MGKINYIFFYLHIKLKLLNELINEISRAPKFEEEKSPCGERILCIITNIRHLKLIFYRSII